MKHHRPPVPPTRADIVRALRRQLALAGTRGPVKCTVTLARAILAELERMESTGEEEGSREGQI